MSRKKLLSMSIMGNSTWLEWFLQLLYHASDSTLWARPLSWRPPGFGGYPGKPSREIPEQSREILGTGDQVSADLKLFWGWSQGTWRNLSLNSQLLSGTGITIIIIISQSYVSSPHRIGLEHCNNLREREMLRQFSPLIHISPSLPTQ